VSWIAVEILLFRLYVDKRVTCLRVSLIKEGRIDLGTGEK
jgi:hypothetical protein